MAASVSVRPGAPERGRTVRYATKHYTCKLNLLCNTWLYPLFEKVTLYPLYPPLSAYPPLGKVTAYRVILSHNLWYMPCCPKMRYDDVLINIRSTCSFARLLAASCRGQQQSLGGSAPIHMPSAGRVFGGSS